MIRNRTAFGGSENAGGTALSIGTVRKLHRAAEVIGFHHPEADTARTAGNGIGQHGFIGRL